MPSGGSCLLGSMNLAEFVKDGEFDYEDFSKCVKIAVEELNIVLDEGLPLHPLQEQKDSVHDWRQIGLGIFGLADMLIKLKIKYGSRESIELCGAIARVMINSALISSSDLAVKDGCYPKYKWGSINSSDFLHCVANSATVSKIKEQGLRNSQILTIAPTGSISTMLRVSGGVEPIFANYYTRKTESLHGEDVYYKVYTPIVDEYIKSNNLKDDSQLPYYFITAQELGFNERIEMQGIWQDFIDASISSTVNVPNDFTVEQVEELYIKAWERGLKGITVYRDGCKRGGVLTTESTKQEVEIEETKELPRGMIIKADDNCIGLKRTLMTGCGTLHCEAFFDPTTGDLLETYFSKGSSGGCVSEDTEYFNGKTWKKISEYSDGEKVLQYNKDGSAELVEPLDYIVNEDVEYLNQFKNRHIDMILSDDHNMFLYKNYSKYKSGMNKKLSSELITVEKWMSEKKNRWIPTTFSFSGSGINLTKEEIRTCVMVYADGSICNENSGYVSISVVKERKKERIRKILSECGIEWKEFEYERIPKYTIFKFYPTTNLFDWLIDKQFSDKWYNCNTEQLKVILDEITYWDGNSGSGNRMGEYYSSKKEEIDFIQFAFSSLGYRATISENGKVDSFRVRPTISSVLNIKHAETSKVKTTDGKSYCFMVPSSMLVLRHNGKIFITGNCNSFMVGLSRMISLSARGGIDIYSIVDQLNSTLTCPSYAVRRATKHDTSKGSCCPTAIGNALLDMYDEIQDELGNREETVKPKMVGKEVIKEAIKTVRQHDKMKCPECGEELQFSGGCMTCTKGCGWSKCD